MGLDSPHPFDLLRAVSNLLPQNLLWHADLLLFDRGIHDLGDRAAFRVDPDRLRDDLTASSLITDGAESQLDGFDVCGSERRHLASCAADKPGFGHLQRVGRSVGDLALHILRRKAGLSCQIRHQAVLGVDVVFEIGRGELMDPCVVVREGPDTIVGCLEGCGPERSAVFVPWDLDAGENSLRERLILGANHHVRQDLVDGVLQVDDLGQIRASAVEHRGSVGKRDDRNHAE